MACSDKCRVRFHRQQHQLRYLAMDPNMDRFKPGSGVSVMDAETMSWMMGMGVPKKA